MNRTKLSVVAVVLAMLVISLNRDCEAQSENAAPKQLLFRGRPLPVCKSFLIYESGMLIRINSPAAYDLDKRAKEAGTLDIGLMWNRSVSSAVGGIVHMSIDGGSTLRFAGLVRYRRWLGEMPSKSGARPLRLDFDAGIVAVTLDEGIPNQSGVNFSAGVALNLEDLVALTVRYETYRARAYKYIDYNNEPYVEKTMPSASNGTLYVGVKSGSYIGVGTSLVVGAIVAVIAISFRNID